MQAGQSAGDEVARSLRAAEEHRRKATWHEERAAAFARGRIGEVAAARALDTLTADGYLRIDDCRWPGRAKANVDHILIGPAGLFVIDAKNWSGHVDIRDGMLRQNGHRRAKEVSAAGEAARAVGALVPFGLLRAKGVICLTGEARLPTAHIASITVVSALDIVDWIRSKPAVLRPEAVRANHIALSKSLQPAGSGSAPQSPSFVPDFIPATWPGGPARREPAASARRATVSRPVGRKRATGPRFSPTWALVGRALLLLVLLDAVVSAVLTTSLRTGNLILAVLCAAWLVRLGKRRPTLTQLSPTRHDRRHR
jgi:Nuclease-related domain